MTALEQARVNGDESLVEAEKRHALLEQELAAATAALNEQRAAGEALGEHASLHSAEIESLQLKLSAHEAEAESLQGRLSAHETREESLAKEHSE